MARLQPLHGFFEVDNTKARAARSKAVCNGLPRLRGVQLIKLRKCGLLPNSAVQWVVPERPHAQAGPKPANGIPRTPREFICKPMSSSEMRDTDTNVGLRPVHLWMSWFFRVFVYGHGWSRRSWPELGTVPKLNRQWRAEKLAANGAGDANTDEHLEADGWTVLPFWDHDDRNPVTDLVATELLPVGPPMPRRPGVVAGGMGLADSHRWGRSYVSWYWDRGIPNSSAGVQ